VKVTYQDAHISGVIVLVMSIKKALIYTENNLLA